jgi:hypothetical protein
MTTRSANGASTAAFEDEIWSEHELLPEDPFAPAAMEDEWGGHAYAASPEDEGEYGIGESFYEGVATEDEWEAAESSPFAGTLEDEWGGYESMHETEDEWGGYESIFETEDQRAAPEGSYELTLEYEADPFIGGLAARAFPHLVRAATPAVRRLLPAARRAIPGVVQSILGGEGPVTGAAMDGLLQEGEATAAAFEAQYFGDGETDGEVAANELAHEAALTEELAAEAAHTESDPEAQSLLGAALPLTITIMRARGPMRRYLPILVRANARLLRSIRGSGPAGRQLSRLTVPIQRRTIASLAAAQRAGRPLPTAMVPQVMAAQAARVLASPQIAGPALVRNTAVRHGTVAPAGQIVTPPHPEYGY